jgi:hypothetical protein
MANFQRDKYSPLFRDATSWVVCSSILALTDAQLAQLTDRRHRGGRENRQGRWLKDLADRIDPLPDHLATARAPARPPAVAVGRAEDHVGRRVSREQFAARL